MRWTTRTFLARRRIDDKFLAIGSAAMPFRHGITPLVALIFSAVGLYLVAGRHRSARFKPKWFIVTALAYAGWTLTMIAVRGDAFFDNRQVTYTVLIALMAFMANGLVLVRDPLRSMVIGARIGTLAVAAAALASSFSAIDRFGMGGNPAPFAMIVAITMVAAILPLANAPRWAPNSRLYLAAGAIAIFASQTRAVLVVLPLIIAAELFFWLRSKPARTQRIGYALAAAAAIALVSVGPVNRMIEERFLPIAYYYAGDSSAWQNSATGDLRLAMWQGAAHAIAERPLLGHGEDKMARVVALAPDLQEELRIFAHVHNFLLDEWLARGIIGLALLLATLALAFGHLLRHVESPELFRNVVYVGLVALSYGMLHNPLLHETTIIALFFYVGVLIAHTFRRMRRAAYRDGSTTLRPEPRWPHAPGS